MSFRKLVPPGVPSVTHSSRPAAAVVAARISRSPSTRAAPYAYDEALPGLRSPSAVKLPDASSVIGSDPWTPSSAQNTSLSPTCLLKNGSDSADDAGRVGQLDGAGRPQSG